MGHNVSPEKRHRRLLDSRLADWKGNYLVIRCSGPGHPPRGAAWPIDVAEPNVPGLTVGGWVRRLRCRVCGRPAEGVAIRVPAHPGRLSPQDRFHAARGLGAGDDDHGYGDCGPHQVQWWRLPGL